MTQHRNNVFIERDRSSLPAIGITYFKKIVRTVSVIAAVCVSIPSQARDEQISLTSGANDPSQSELKKNIEPQANADFVDLATSPNAFNALANDVDRDGDRLIMVEAIAKFGAVAFTPEGLLAYAQNPGPARADEITYMISDGRGGFDKGVVEIRVR